MSNHLPTGYRLIQGSSLDRALLVKFMQRTYQAIAPGVPGVHLADTVDQYLSHDTPLWWVEPVEHEATPSLARVAGRVMAPIACLWLGTAVDQAWGDRHTHIFLLYVAPEHRRRGIGTALMRHAEDWARSQGDRQIGLQVFQSNEAALNLYRSLGFQTQSLWLVKPLRD